MLSYEILNYIVYKFRRTARKSHTCELCGCEIHKGEDIWWYKPKPKYNKITKKKLYSSWRKRCGDHEPKSYAELELIYSMETAHGSY